MLPKSKVDLYAAIRRDSRQGMSNRALQRKYGVGFLTVQKALSSAWPEPRKQLPPRATRLDPFKPLIDQMLRADLDAPRDGYRYVLGDPSVCSQRRRHGSDWWPLAHHGDGVVRDSAHGPDMPRGYGYLHQFLGDVGTSGRGAAAPRLHGDDVDPFPGLGLPSPHELPLDGTAGQDWPDRGQGTAAGGGTSGVSFRTGRGAAHGRPSTAVTPRSHSGMSFCGFSAPRSASRRPHRCGLQMAGQSGQGLGCPESLMTWRDILHGRRRCPPSVHVRRDSFDQGAGTGIRLAPQNRRTHGREPPPVLTHRRSRSTTPRQQAGWSYQQQATPIPTDPHTSAGARVRRMHDLAGATAVAIR